MAKKQGHYDAIRLKPATPAENFDDWKGVWVIVQQREGTIQDVTLELLAAGRPMADKLGVQQIAVLLGHNVGEMAEQLIQHGADEVLVCDHPTLAKARARPYADVLTRLIEEKRPEIILIGATHTGRDISSRIAVTAEAGMTADCTELDVDPHSGELLARRPAFGGRMLATIRCDRHRPQMATARPGIFRPGEPDTGRTGNVEEVDVTWLSEDDYAAEILKYELMHGVDITKSDVLVAGGMGIGGPEGFEKLQELADLLGGDVAASRPVCDNGWMSRDRQVGQTGLSVRPKVYLAIGISGAIQHIEGMKEAGTVVAINQDPNAKIFQYADIGIVADWKKVVDDLIQVAKEKDLDAVKWRVPTKDTLDADRQAAAERAGKKEDAGEKKPSPPAKKKETSEPAAAGPATPTDDEADDEEETPDAEDPEADAAPETNGHAGSEPEEVSASDTLAPFDGDPGDEEAVKAYAEKVPEEKKAWVVAADCIVCNGCEAACPTDAAIVTDTARVDRDLCIADGACFDACPTDAIRPGVEDKEESTGWPEGSRLAGQFGT